MKTPVDAEYFDEVVVRYLAGETTEAEGVPMLAGHSLGGGRGVLLMQSSGVGNCINQLSLIDIGRFPFFTIVTMALPGLMFEEAAHEAATTGFVTLLLPLLAFCLLGINFGLSCSLLS